MPNSEKGPNSTMKNLTEKKYRISGGFDLGPSYLSARQL